MTKELDVVVWDGRPESPNLSKCLRSLQHEAEIGEVVVVKRARRTTPGAARNAGVRGLSGRRHLGFIGADVEVQTGWAAAMLEALASGAGIAAGPCQLGDPFGRNGFLPWGSALNLAVRREVFERLGGFEEGLPALDDADFCFRSQLAGHGFATAGGAEVVVMPPSRRSEAGEAVRAGRAEALLAWRYRANPYFATRPRGRTAHRPPAALGAAAGWLQLLASQRPVPDLVLGHEAERYVVMPLVAGPAAIVRMRDDQDVPALAADLRDCHDLASGLPGPDSGALARWDERPGWALASTRAARAAGWAFEPGLAARRLEHEHPKNVGAAFVQMGAVLAWYQGARGYVLLTYGDTASRLAERLPDVALIDLAGGDDLSARLPPASAMREVQAPGPGPQGSEPARPKRASGSTPSVRDLQPRDPLLLVSGGPRSGTTMLRNMLAAHPLLAAPLDEGFFVTQVFGEMKLAHRTDDVAWAWELTKAHRFFQAWDLDTEALDAVIAERPPASYADLLRVLFAALAAREHKPFSMDKCTAYSLHWEWLAEQFPTTRFALIVRDPREVCMSQAVQYFSHGGVAGAAWWWLFHVMGTKKVAAALGDRWLEIRYEDLVADPVKQLDALCRHAGIEFDEAMLRYPDAGSKPVSVLHHAASQAPRQDLRSWRGALSHDDLVTIERITGPVMTRFGYEPETRGITPGAVDMTARYLVKEARNQWLLSGAPRPSALENFLGLKWKHQQ